VAAKTAFEEGIHALATLFAALPAAHANIMGALVADYAQECKNSGEPPDIELLAPIVEVFEKLREAQTQQET